MVGALPGVLGAGWRGMIKYASKNHIFQFYKLTTLPIPGDAKHWVPHQQVLQREKQSIEPP
jgi:hypothetical protein